MAFGDLTSRPFDNLNAMNRDDIVVQASEWAGQAHESIGQKRKYSGLPYIVHPLAVCKILEDAGERNPNVLIAALLHDVLEDVAPQNNRFDADEILRRFGVQAVGMVHELTDVFTKENYPDLNRDERKKGEAERISKITDGALKVKLADLIDNTSDIMKHDPGFGKVYLKEKNRVLDLLYPRMLDTKDPIILELYHRARSLARFHQTP